ncbi:MAG TPA: phosphatidate cytidylyltransferase [Anaerolineae bacterium]|nr:phosphatidate cytidylyltransferase [Anaerolineae bacterium]
MTSNDIVGLIASYIYAFGLLFVVEGIGKWRKWPQFLTRKLIHIGAGMWIWGILALFDHWTFGVIPFATFIILNYVFYRQQTFKAMDDEKATPGTVYFAISITILFALLWRTGGVADRVPVAAAAVMAMTWGDGVASIVGKRWGKHPYTVFGHTRTWEGTAAMAICAFIGIGLTLWLLSASALSPNSAPVSFGRALSMAVIGTIVATAAESVSPAGTDNLSVPLLTGLVLYFVV